MPCSAPLRQPPCSSIAQRRRQLLAGRSEAALHQGLALAQERAILGEEAFLDSILHDMGEFLLRQPGRERGHDKGREPKIQGRIKSHGAVRAELQDLTTESAPEALQAASSRARATTRLGFSSAAMATTRPTTWTCSGLLGMNIKLLGVPGPKLLDDEKTNARLGLVQRLDRMPHPDVRADAQLQGEILRGTPLFYFFNRQSRTSWTSPDAAAVEPHPEQPRPSAITSAARPICSAKARP